MEGTLPVSSSLPSQRRTHTEPGGEREMGRGGAGVERESARALEVGRGLHLWLTTRPRACIRKLRRPKTAGQKSAHPSPGFTQAAESWCSH